MPPRQGPQPSVPQMQDQVQMQQDQAQIGNYQPQQQMTGGPQAVAPQNQQNMANGLANAMKQGPSASGYNPQGSAAGFQKVQGGQMGGSAMRNPSQNMAYARRNARRY